MGKGSSSIMSSFSGAGGTLVRWDMGEGSQGYIQQGCRREGGAPREEVIRNAEAIRDDWQRLACEKGCREVVVAM